jgi:hypothetical protein
LDPRYSLDVNRMDSEEEPGEKGAWTGQEETPSDREHQDTYCYVQKKIREVKTARIPPPDATIYRVREGGQRPEVGEDNRLRLHRGT